MQELRVRPSNEEDGSESGSQRNRRTSVIPSASFHLISHPSSPTPQYHTFIPFVPRQHCPCMAPLHFTNGCSSCPTLPYYPCMYMTLLCCTLAPPCDSDF